MNVNDKLARNHFQAADKPHIQPAHEVDKELMQLLVSACPAGLYRIENNVLLLASHGCLECGTCRLLCNEKTFSRWGYPPAGKGLQLRFG